MTLFLQVEQNNTDIIRYYSLPKCTNYIHIYIYIYMCVCVCCHLQTVSFVVSPLFSVGRYAGRFKLGSKAV